MKCFGILGKIGLIKRDGLLRGVLEQCRSALEVSLRSVCRSPHCRTACAVASALFRAVEQPFFMGGDLVSLGHLGCTNDHIFLGASSSQMSLVPLNTR